jgi:dipeptidyl aminopeptidase/acylaminoacyl peptidase
MIRVLGLFVLAALTSTVAAQPLPVEEFFKRPDYSHLTLSPDGRRVAAVVRGRTRDSLAVIDVETKTAAQITNFVDSDVLRFHWTNNNRLLFAVGDAREAVGNACFHGWYAVNADGSELRAIDRQEDRGLSGAHRAPGTEAARAPMPWLGVASPCAQARGRNYMPGFRYLSPDPAGGDDIVIEARLRRGALDAYRYNTKSGEVKLLSWERPDGVFGWMVDRDGVPRVAASYDRGITTIWYRDGESVPWKKLDEGEDSKIKIQPLAFDYDNRTLYVASPGSGDKAAIYRYDFKAGQLGERLARHLDVDMDTMIFSRAKRQLLGFAYDADKAGVVWVDEHMARLQQMVDRALPDTLNVVRVAGENPKRALIRAYSDINPESFYLFDTEKLTIRKFASSRPWIKPGEMSERKFVRYKARDGLEIPAYLTIPKQTSGKNLPLVVEIHGGPWTGKQSWGFDTDAQFLASRGYAVLQPDFRGTIGYGRRHFVSSFGQWGLSMQDDITDGVEWLVGNGIADRNRICLFGGSYGGYAALWGLMKTPELYRCGVALAAVTDIGLYFSITWSDIYWSPYRWLEYGAKIRIGDPDRDADKFRSVSPIYHAERLKAPVLLAFGGVDQRVPLKHGTALRDALDKHSKKYEWIVYSDEGHGFGEDKNRFDFYRRVEAFLKQHLN